MSTPGKIFTVLNAILAALFLGWASNNLATSAKYKQDYDAKVAELEAYRAEKEAELSGLNSTMATKESTLGQIRSERDDLKARADRLTGELAQARATNEGLNADIAQIKSSLDNYDQTNRANASRAEQAIADKTAADEARRAAEDEREDALERMRAAEETLQAAQEQIAALERERETMRQQLTQVDAQLTAMSEATGISIGEIAAIPAIDGSVVQVINSVQPGLIAINRGAAHGVKRGFTFDVYSGNQYKGQVRVENVQQDMCTAVIVRTYENRSIAQGDRASTQI